LAAASNTINALSTAVRSVAVLAEMLVARRVQGVEGQPLCSKLITAYETEMPRSRSTAI
jgi:hypothetical protein